MEYFLFTMAAKATAHYVLDNTVFSSFDRIDDSGADLIECGIDLLF